MAAEDKDHTVEIEGLNLKTSYQQLPAKLFTSVRPTPVKKPAVVMYNESLGKDLGVAVKNPDSSKIAAVFSGNEIPKDALPIAQAYAGHQFGHFTVLGDGRAILLGEQITPKGERYDIQLKGSGRTPYSRRGDGRAGLGPMLREYIISEALHALGIPSTRALAVVSTGETILREKRLPGAILTRVASSHIRVGTFEYIAHFGNINELKALADYTIERHFPNMMSTSPPETEDYGNREGSDNKYLSFFEQVLDRQALLMAKWQLIGFIHGVMNTDNMALSGETIDYGPCAFMNRYDPDTVFSSIDRGGRYAYKNQPQIAQWNLARLAETLIPLIHQDQAQGIETIKKSLQTFSLRYERYWRQNMGKKIGIFQASKEDVPLMEELLQIMKEENQDFTNTFFALTYDKENELTIKEHEQFLAWLDKWKARLEEQKKTEGEVKELMRAHNPVLIPRNHQVERAIDAAVEKEDYSVMENLMKALRSPYQFSSEKEPYQLPPDPSDKPYVTYCGT